MEKATEVAVDKSAPDRLDPSVPVSDVLVSEKAEAKESDEPTAEDYNKAREAKAAHYAKENEANDVSRSVVDPSQEAHLSPEAQKQIEKSRAKAEASKK